MKNLNHLMLDNAGLITISRHYVKKIGFGQSAMIAFLLSVRYHNSSEDEVDNQIPFIPEMIQDHLGWDKKTCESILTRMDADGYAKTKEKGGNTYIILNEDKLSEIDSSFGIDIPKTIPEYLFEFKRKVEAEKESKRTTGVPAPCVIVKGVPKPMNRAALEMVYGLSSESAFELISKFPNKEISVQEIIDFVNEKSGKKPSGIDFEKKNLERKVKDLTEKIEALEKEKEEPKPRRRGRKKAEEKQPNPPESLLDVYKFAAEYYKTQKESGDERYGLMDFLSRAESGYRNYENSDPKWIDSNGKPVLNWRMKIQKVYFQEMKQAPYNYKPSEPLEKIMDGIDFKESKELSKSDFDDMGVDELVKLSESRHILAGSAKEYIKVQNTYLEEDLLYFKNGQARINIGRYRVEKLGASVPEESKNEFQFTYQTWFKK